MHFSSANLTHTLPMPLPQFDHPNNNWHPIQFHTSLHYAIFKIRLFFVPLVSKYRFIILPGIYFCSLSITIPICHDCSPSVLVHSCASFTMKTKPKKEHRKVLVYCIAVNVRLPLFMLKTFVVSHHIKISPISF